MDRIIDFDNTGITLNTLRAILTHLEDEHIMRATKTLMTATGLSVKEAKHFIDRIRLTPVSNETRRILTTGVVPLDTCSCWMCST